MRCSIENCIHWGDCDFGGIMEVDQPEDCATYKNKFTEEDLDECWAYYKTYLLELLNKEMSIESARENLASLIDSDYDPRIKRAKALRVQIKNNAEKIKGNNLAGQQGNCDGCGLRDGTLDGASGILLCNMCQGINERKTGNSKLTAKDVKGQDEANVF